MFAEPIDHDNRRASQRYPLRTQAFVEIPGQPPFAVRTLDISSGGMAIVAAANPRRGTTFNIRLTIPVEPTGSVSFVTTAQVVHSVLSSAEDGFKVGLAFTKLEPASAEAIMQYINASAESIMQYVK